MLGVEPVTDTGAFSISPMPLFAASVKVPTGFAEEDISAPASFAKA